tara:strand:- start:1206 stop:1475 length:270 start_codon:yes stop_codon:yes gene_type:complete
VEVRTRKLFKELVKKLTLELLDEENLEEITTTAGAPGYMTPFAFKGKKKKKKKVDEAIDDKDLKQITKLIRAVVADILRDIWLKRAAWK